MKVPSPNALRPFDEGGVSRGADGIKRYDDLPASVVELVRARVEATPLREAVVVLDGPRVSYRELWDSAARVAGGLREAGVGRGDRVAIRHGNCLEWVQAFLGTLMAGAVITFPYYLHTNPTMVALARRGIAEVLADLA